MIAIGSDHAGYALKKKLMTFLNVSGNEFKDFGCYDENSVDYPVIAEEVAKAVASGEFEKGILICGTGIGMSMAANKVKGIRAALCTNEFSAKYTRLHNDANILCLGARVTGDGLAQDITEIFLDTEFEGGRHLKRLDLIKELENK